MPTQFDPEAFLAAPVSLDGPNSVFAPKPVAPAAPAFDFSQPHTTVSPAAPAFDFSQPHTTVAPAGPAFDLSQPSQRVYTPEEVKNLTPQQLADDKRFNPIAFGQTNPNDIPDNVVEAYRIRETRGTTLGQKATAVKEGTLPALKALGGAIPKIAQANVDLTLPGVAKAAYDAVKEHSFEPLKRPAKSAVEAIDSLELAVNRTAEAGRKTVRELREGMQGSATGKALALTNPILALGAESKVEQSPEDWKRRYFDDVAGASQLQKIGEGNGAVAQALKIDAETLKPLGIVVNPETIEALSLVTDPINYVPVGGAVFAATKAGGKLLQGIVANTVGPAQAARLAAGLNAATQTAAGLTGGALKTVGGSIERVGEAATSALNKVGGVVTGAGLGALLGHDFITTLGAAAVAKGVPKAVTTLGEGIAGAGKIIAGEQAAPVLAQVAGQAIKGGLHSAADAAVLTLPFEIGANQDEEAGILGMVGVAGILGATTHGAAPAASAAGKAAQLKLSDTIFRHVEQADFPAADLPYQTDSALDAQHTANVSRLDQASQKLVSWGRNLLRGAGGEVYVLDGPTFENATGNKNSVGFTTSPYEVTDAAGNKSTGIRIYLNKDAVSLPHEFFHALEALDPTASKNFIAEVQKNLTPEQQAGFEQYYDTLLNGTADASKWKHTIKGSQVAGEVAAESFSRLFLSQDLSGVAPSVVNSTATFISSILEKMGVPLGGINQPKGSGVSSLRVKPNANEVVAGREWIENLTKRVNETGTLGEPPIIAPPATLPVTPAPAPAAPGSVPLPVTPVPAAPAPAPAPAPVIPVPTPRPLPTTPGANPPTPGAAPNIRTTPAKQNDFAGRRSEQTGIDRARVAADKTGDAALIARVNELADHIENGGVVEVDHSGVTATGYAENRGSRRAAQEAAYINEALGTVPAAIRTQYQKVLAPYALDVQGGKPQLLAMSLDKVIANVNKLVEWAADKNASKLIPYETVAGKLTDAGWQAVVSDLQSYAANQRNGYRGDGAKLIRPKTDVGLSIPVENPSYTPVQLEQAKADFLNTVQGLNPPLTAREGRQSSAVVPGNVKGQILAEVNKRQPEKPAVIRPEDIGKQDFKSQPGRSVAETNPLRNELARAGVPVRELIEVTERLNLADVKAVKPRPDLNFSAPVTDTIRGGFLPKEDSRSVEKPAYRVKSSGKVISGAGWHPPIFSKIVGDVQKNRFPEILSAEEFKKRPWSESQGIISNALEAGFVTREKEFLNREEAFQRGKELGQVSEQVEKSQYGENQLDSSDLNSDGKFAPRELNEDVRKIAEPFLKSAPHTGYDSVNPELAKRLADFYESAKSDPTNPEVVKAYTALVDETLAQGEAIKAAGYTPERFTGQGEPYKSSADMVADVRDNKHLYYLATEGNFSGSESNPMLRQLPDGSLVNDVFRWVHDFFGHAKEGYQFGPRGEFNAWKAHSTMYSPEAQGALAAETLAQNSWVNSGAHLRDVSGNVIAKGQPGYVDPVNRPFAEQKNIVVPPELIAEASGKFQPSKEDQLPTHGEPYDFHFVRNLEKAPNFGARFGQDIEPAGRYLNQSAPEYTKDLSKQFDKGEQHFNQPYVIDFGGQYGEATNWKNVLSERYGGKTGKALSRALQADGYDGIMTVENGHTSEIVDLANREGRFQPATEAGRKLVEDGYDIYATGIKGNRSIRLDKDGSYVGSISSTQTSPDKARIGLSSVLQESQKKGLGETLYRELFKQLQEDGVKEVSGHFIHPGPLAIRKKIFGGVEELTLDKKPVDLTDAIKVASTAKGTTKPFLLEGKNFITPESKFQPKFEYPPEPDILAEDFSKYVKAKTAPSAVKLPKGVTAGSRDGVQLTGSALEHSMPEELSLVRLSSRPARPEATPANFGKGKATAKDLRGAPKVFFYEEGSPLGGDEAIFVGAHPSSAKISGSRIYDVVGSDDALGYLSEPNREKADKKLIDAGYTGFRTVTDDGRQVVATYYPVKMTPAGEPIKAGATHVKSEQGQFLPADRFSDELDPIVSPAVQTPEGELFKGDWHGQARENWIRQASPEKAADIINNDRPDDRWAIGTDGFVTRSGKFLDRDQALEHALKIQQIRADSESAQTRRGKGGLESEVFNQDQIVQERGGNYLPKPIDENTPLLDLNIPSDAKAQQLRQKEKVRINKERFPEAIPLRLNKDEAGNFILGADGKPKPAAINYDLLDTPLALEAAKGIKGIGPRSEAYTDALAKRLVESAKEAAKSQDIAAGVKWYSTARTRLKGLLGEDSKFFSELLGATSARTPVDLNFRFALDAYNQFKAGKFDATLAKYREGKSNWDTGDIADFKKATGNEDPTRGQYLDWWVSEHDLAPVQSNSKKFGANSRSVLRVLDGSWASEVQGPKTAQFAQNLHGASHGATIDVWAARLLHELSNEGNPKRWRILPGNETGVTDADFYLGQAAFRKAAEELKMKPDALQAICWFYLKDRWEKRGWTKGVGAEKSDFNSLLKDTERTPSGQLQIKKKQLDFGLSSDDIKAKK